MEIILITVSHFPARRRQEESLFQQKKSRTKVSAVGPWKRDIILAACAVTRIVFVLSGMTFIYSSPLTLYFVFSNSNSVRIKLHLPIYRGKSFNYAKRYHLLMRYIIYVCTTYRRYISGGKVKLRPRALKLTAVPQFRANPHVTMNCKVKIFIHARAQVNVCIALHRIMKSLDERSQPPPFSRF
jgi:hypothetical protein